MTNIIPFPKRHDPIRDVQSIIEASFFYMIAALELQLVLFGLSRMKDLDDKG